MEALEKGPIHNLESINPARKECRRFKQKKQKRRQVN
jgi:hypothetical protein